MNDLNDNLNGYLNILKDSYIINVFKFLEMLLILVPTSQRQICNCLIYTFYILNKIYIRFFIILYIFMKTATRISVQIQMVLFDRNSIHLPPHLFAPIINVSLQSLVFLWTKHVCSCYRLGSRSVHLYINFTPVFFCNTGTLQSINMNMHWLEELFYLVFH